MNAVRNPACSAIALMRPSLKGRTLTALTNWLAGVILPGHRSGAAR